MAAVVTKAVDLVGVNEEPIEKVMSVDELLEAILSHLTAHQLGVAASVCKRWRVMIRGIKQRRPKRISCQYFENDCDLNNEKLDSFVKQQQLPPKFCLTFSTETLRQSIVKAHKKSDITSSGCIRFLLPRLSRECETYSTTGYGCIGTTSSRKVIENEGTKGFSCLLIPDLEDFSMTPVFLKDNVVDKFKGQALKAFVVIHNNVEKCAQLVTDFLQLCPDIVVAGGYVKRHAYFSHISSYLGQVPSTNLTTNYPLVGFVISGRAVNVASTVLAPDVLEPKDIKEAFEKLRLTGICSNRDSGRGNCESFALVFSCNGRGSSHYGGQKNVEADAFMTAFPNVPLLGFFGYGEIGHDYLPDFTNDSPDRGCKRKKASYEGYLDSITRGYSSVFIVVSIQHSQYVEVHA